MKIDRFYIRDGVPGFSLEKQQAMQAEAGYADVPTYADVYTGRGARRKALELEQRKRMLQKTGRDTVETIGVAGARCIADSIRDLRDVVSACEARKASIYCLDTQRLIDPCSGPPSAVIQLFSDYDDAGRRQQTAEGRKTAYQARTKKAEIERTPIIAFALPLWQKPTEEITTAQIVAEVRTKFKRKVGVSSLNKWLGSRWEAAEAAKSRKRPL